MEHCAEESADNESDKELQGRVEVGIPAFVEGYTSDADEEPYPPRIVVGGAGGLYMA